MPPARTTHSCWISPTPETTRSAALALARALGPSLPTQLCTLALDGALGAGKTAFVQGLAVGLGVPSGEVASPTFTLCNEHSLPSGGVLAHVDWYRIERAGELEATGFFDLMDPGNVLAVEWSDRFPGLLPDDRIEITIERASSVANSPGPLAAGAEVGDATALVEARRLTLAGEGSVAREVLERWAEGLETSLERARGQA